MSTIKVNIADATIADLQTKLGLNRSVAKVITEQKPCNMEKFLQIEGVDWDDIKSKEPNAELEFISANESMSTDNKPVLPDGSELPSENITGEFIKFTQQYWQTQQAEFNKFTQLMTKKLETCQSKIPVNKLDMNDSKSEIKEEMQHFQLAVESVNKKGIKVENINEINPQNSELGTSNGKDSYQSEHESVNGKNLQHSDSEVPSCKESVSSKPVHNDHKKDENDFQCKHAKTKTDHFAEYHQVYESKVVDGVYRPTNTTNSDPKSTGQGHSDPSSLMQNGINLAEEHNRNGVIVKDGVSFSLPALPNQASESIMGKFERFTQFQSVMQGEFNKFAQQMSVRDGVVVTKPNPTLVAKNAQIMQQPTSYSREGVCETVEADFNVWNKKLAYLPKFDGTNWQAFISVFERNLSRHNLSDSLQLDLLESKLSGQAFQAYGQAHTSMDTYEELKKFLQSRFGTRITPQIRRNELFHMKQRTDETLIEFSSRVKSIAYEGFPEMNSKQRSELEVHAFLQGCQEKTFAERVILNTHPDLDSALNDMKKMVQNAHIFKSSNLEKARVVHHINNSEDTETSNMTTVTSNDDEYPDQRGLAYTDSRAQNVDSPQIGNVEVKTTISPSQGKSARVDVTVLGKSISGMIDSAAQVTVIDHKCWLTITGSPPVGKEVKLTQVDVNRNMVAILVPDVEIQVGTYHIKMPIFVTDLHVSDKLLLGLDFLSSAGAVLHILKNTTTTGAVQTPINLTHNKNCVVQPTLLAGQVHTGGDAEKIDEPPIMFDHLWGDAETIYKPPIMFDHLWGDAEKIYKPPIMFDHLWGDAEKIDEPPIMFDHLWGDAEKIDEPPIMFDHLWEQLSRPPDKCDCYQTGNDLGCNYCTRMSKLWEQLSRPPDKCVCHQTGNDLGCNHYTRLSKLWEQLSRPPDKCVGHQTGNDLGCNHYTRLSKLWEQLSRPPDRCDCYLVSNNLSKLPCGGCNYCIRMNKQWEQLTRPPDECNYYQAGNDPSKLHCGGCKYCTRMSKQWEQFPLDVDDVLPSTVLDPLKIINAEIRAVNVVKESTLHTPAPNWCSTLLVSDIRDKQREDPDLILAVNWVFNETVPTQAELAMSSTVARFYWSNRNLLSEKNEIIYYRWIEDTSSRDLIIVPRALKEVVLSGCHDEITAGHFSSRKTLSRIRQNYFWKNMSQDCSLYVHSCVNCSTQKKANLTARAPLINYQAGNPLDRVHIDILGPFPISRSGNRYVLMLIDQFTRWLEAYPLPDQTAEQVARVVVDQFIARFGSPLYIHSDQGRNFGSDLFGSVCELLDIVKTRTTPTHPASNGQVERYNTILLALIRCHIDGASDKWDEAVPLLAGAIRSMQNRHTGMTANMLMLGREVRRPISLAYSFNELVPQSCPHEYVKELLKNFHEVHHLASDKLKTAMKIQKQAYDTKIREADLVYRRNLLLKKGDSRKLAPPWVGPFLVVQQLSEVTYKGQGKRRSFVLHHNILRPCRDRSIPFWMRRLRHRFLKNLDQEDDPIMFDHLWDDVKKVSDPSPKYTEPSLRVPIDGIHTPEEFDSNVKSNPKNSEGSNSAIGVVVNEKINETTDLMANKQVNEAINLVPLQEPIISRSGRPRKLPRHLNDYNL